MRIEPHAETSLGRVSAADRIREHKESIVDAWHAYIVKRLPPEARHDKHKLVNAIPEFLDRLANALEPGVNGEDANRGNVLSTEHGIQRADIGHYTVDRIMTDYFELEHAIMDTILPRGPLSADEAKTIVISLQTAMAEAVKSFVSAVEYKRNEAETEYQILVREVKDYAIFMLDPSGVVATWNVGAERIKGWKAQEAIGHHFRMLYCEEDRIAGRPEKNIELTRIHGRHEEQWWRVRKDGTRFWAMITITAMYNGGGKLIGFSKVVRDLTEKKRTEDELKTAKEASDAASHMKTTFLANMSHEIRTPLNAILGFSDMLGEPSLTEEMKKNYHEIIHRNGRVLGRLIDDILDLSKIEAGRLEVEIVRMPIRQMFGEIVGFFEGRAREKGVDVTLNIPDETPDYISSDPVRIRQILNNIVGNAVKFTDKGEIKVFAHVKNRMLRRPILCIRVEDSGPGISPEDRERLFKPFSQVDESTTRRFGGTGLGLALSRRLARELGGDVEILDCPPGRGCIFEIHVEDQAAANRTYPTSESPKRPMDRLTTELLGRRILVVEDSKDNQLLVSRILAKHGASVEVAVNGLEGYEKALRGKYDLVLMDIQMPVLDGLSATQKLRAHGFENPIVALTAHAMPEEREKCLAAGCDDHLVKPIDSEILVTKVAEYANA